MEPDSKGAPDLQGGQRVARCSPILMGGLVPDALQMIEHLADLARQGGADLQSAKRIVERDVNLRQNALPCRDILRNKLGELPQLDQRARCIVDEVALS